MPVGAASVLCWVNRNLQNLPGRWRLDHWLSRNGHLVDRIAPGPARIGPGYFIWGDPRDFDSRRYLMHGISPREPITNVMASLLAPGDVAIDVGANVGYFSAVMSMLVGPTGRVYAYEPAPTTFSHLGTLLASGGRNIIATQAAVSDREGRAKLSLGSESHSGRASLREFESEAGSVDVPCITLDSTRGRVGPAKLVKIDVEGFEMKVLRGMHQILSKDRAYVILELSDTFLRAAGSSAGEVVAFMSEQHYVGYVLTVHGGATDLNKELLPLDLGLISSQVDVLFIAEEMPVPRFNPSLSVRDIWTAGTKLARS